jgi:magnesium chelatase family protein
MFIRLLSNTVEGLQVHPVEVEVSTGKGLPGMVIVGLPGKAIMESRDRVKTALQNTSMPYPRAKITVNLAPGDLRKEGPFFDLPIAIGVMVCTDFLKPVENLAKFCFVGELALNGDCRPIPGILSMAENCLKQGWHLVCPLENYSEAALVSGLSIIPVANLNDVHAFLSGTLPLESLLKLALKNGSPRDEAKVSLLDFRDVKGQHSAKRAMLISAAGQHNLLMIGPPGSGKSMLAERYPGLLPELNAEEALEVTKIHSVAGLLQTDSPLIRQRPFRSPHHSISEPALIGGGSDARPGEISICHRGVLFLDELPEFKRATLEVLRQPLEAGKIMVSRSKRHCEYPARFSLIAAMNPCPCGYFGSQVRQCRCNSSHVERYLSKLSGPLLDRIDLHIEVTDQSPSALRRQQKPGPSTEELRLQVLRARTRQALRYEGEPFLCNGELRGPWVEKYCKIDMESENLMLKGMEEMGLSTRAFHKVLIVARTIADLDDVEQIHIDHVCEALNYRILDRRYFK